MDNFIFKVLIYNIPIFGAIYAIVSIISKTILKKSGYKVTFLRMAFSDIKNLKKLSKEKTELRFLYFILLLSTICILSLTLLFLTYMILMITSHN